MKQFRMQMQWLLCAIMVSMLLVSCGGSSTPPTPIVVTPGPVSGNTRAATYVNVLVNSVQFNGTVSNYGDQGNLQFIMVVSDDSGHANALICPYGGVIQVRQGDQVHPCQAGLTYPEDILQNHLYVMLIAVDIKDKSDLTTIGFNVVSTSIAAGLHQAILSMAGLSSEDPPVMIGFLALDAVIGYAGNKAQEYFQKNYVIGSQSFALARQYNWNNGQAISAQSTNSQVAFTFTVQKSSTAAGEVVDSAPNIPAAT